MFDSQGNTVGRCMCFELSVGWAWPSRVVIIFDLDAAQLPASAFDNTGRAQLTGIVKSVTHKQP